MTKFIDTISANRARFIAIVAVALLCTSLICSATDLGNPKEPPIPWKLNERLQKRNSVLNEIHDLAGNLPADRSLSPLDIDTLLKCNDYLIDKRRTRFRSGRAAKALGDLGHQAAIPALLAVLRDENDDLSVRKACVVNLTYICDPRVVSYLIEDGLGSSEPEIVMVTLDCLNQFAGHPPKLHDTSYRASTIPPPGYIKRETPDPEELEEYLDIWREWWKREKDNIELNRSNRWVD